MNRNAPPNQLYVTLTTLVLVQGWLLRHATAVWIHTGLSVICSHLGAGRPGSGRITAWVAMLNKEAFKRTNIWNNDFWENYSISDNNVIVVFTLMIKGSLKQL
ncbi:hypothetical protein Zmor_020930 [Zophobas morio]|uniref:Uncharacterized protein n=1 Tax=Zophobas morio TaxID=2755281 RepID=A0AA38MA37_9CUCU|nr:hypothetical protein Zmor_020930 [Zophobas morio]